MANQSKLKAWVRYDGTNTVVTAGPIFRAAKPKVGNWRQINADLCCNPSGSSTTTTTTTGNVTPTTVLYSLLSSGAWSNSTDACNAYFTSIQGQYVTVYAAEGQSVPSLVTTLYFDAALIYPLQGNGLWFVFGEYLSEGIKPSSGTSAYINNAVVSNHTNC